MTGIFRIEYLEKWVQSCLENTETYPYVFHLDEYKGYDETQSEFEQAVKIYKQVSDILYRVDREQKFKCMGHFPLAGGSYSISWSHAFLSEKVNEPPSIYIMRANDDCLRENIYIQKIALDIPYRIDKVDFFFIQQHEDDEVEEEFYYKYLCFGVNLGVVA